LPKDAQYWIDALALSPHPEGGYYRETYRSDETIAPDALPARFDGDRCFSTAIYFLLPSEHVSALHRIRQDELWHFHAGSPLDLHMLDENGVLTSVRLGSDPDAGHVLQAVVSAGSTFGAEVAESDSYSLLGCTVAPGFDFDDFELPSRADLLSLHPTHGALIHRLTHS